MTFKEKTQDDLAYTIGDAQAPAAQSLRINIEAGKLGFTGEAYQAGFKALFVLFVLAGGSS